MLFLTAALKRGEMIMTPTVCELDGWLKFRWLLHLLLWRLGGWDV